MFKLVITGADDFGLDVLLSFGKTPQITCVDWPVMAKAVTQLRRVNRNPVNRQQCRIGDQPGLVSNRFKRFNAGFKWRFEGITHYIMAFYEQWGGPQCPVPGLLGFC